MPKGIWVGVVPKKGGISPFLFSKKQVISQRLNKVCELFLILFIMKSLEIIVRKNISEVELAVAQGYCPVECSFGDRSIVDDLEMDHHGEKSHLESVAIRAYRDHFGKRAENPRFVLNHVDADCIFAVAALAGLLPHPESQYAASLPTFKQKVWKQNLLPLAETIAILDTDPIGRDIIAMPFGSHLITWNAMFGFNVDDELGAVAAVQGWRQLTTASVAVKPYLDAAEASEKARCEAALADLTERGEKIGDVVIIKESRVFGFSEWYQRNLAGAANEVAGWDNPVVIALASGLQSLTFGCPNQDVAEAIFGQGGLKNVFTRLNELYALEPGNGFGGRESVGGSPRGMKMTEEDLRKAADIVNEIISK